MMEDRTFSTSNHPAGGISDAFRQFIEALVEEVVINGEPFDTQKKWLRKNCEAEGLNYENIEKKLNILLEASKELEEYESKSIELLLVFFAKDCYLSETVVKKIIRNASTIRTQKETERKAGEEIVEKEHKAREEANLQKIKMLENKNNQKDSEIKKITMDLDNKEKEVNNIKATLSSTESKLVAEKETNKSLRNDLAKAREDNNDISVTLTKVKAELTEVKNKLIDANNICNILQKERDVSNTKNIALENVVTEQTLLSKRKSTIISIIKIIIVLLIIIAVVGLLL